MIGISIKGLWAHKRRLLGTCFAVVLGVAFLSGTLALNDTFRANFNRLFADANAGTDAIVQSNATLGRANRALIPASLVDSVRSVPGVADAQPSIQGYGQLIGSNGKPLGGNAPRDAGNWITDPALNPYRLVEGRPPRADNEVVINRGAAKKGHLHLGQTTIVQTPQPVRVTIVGIATFGPADGFGETTFTAFTLQAAKEHLTTNPGQISSISVKGASSVTQEELTARIEPKLPHGVEAVTGTQLTKDNLSQLAGQFLTFLRTFMVVFAAIALLVATFSIYNTFSILIAQRTRETALLRTLGASRRQMLASVVTEASVVGTAASAVGLVGGLGIAGLLKGAFNSFGFALPAGGLVFRGATVLVSLIVGIGITLLAALIPAVRASRIPPLAALRDVAVDRTGTAIGRAVSGIALTSAGVIVVLTAIAGSGSSVLARAGLGALVTIIGVVVLGPLVSRPASAIIGAPAAKTRGVTGALARQNAMRNPRRTAATAAALMVGVGVVTLFTVFAASLKNSINHDVSTSFRGDLAVSAGAYYGGARLSPQLVSDVSRLPEVRAAAGLGTGNARLAGSSHEVSVADPTSLSGLLDLHVVRGSLGDLGDRQLAVSKKIVDAKGWHVGTPLSVTYPDGNTDQFTIGAIYKARAIVGDYLLPQASWTPHSTQAIDSTVFVSFHNGVNPKVGQAAVELVARDYGSPRVQARHAYASTAGSVINAFLGIVYVMLALSVIIALLGISNTLSLSAHERTRELGLLRAVGQTRAQLRSMVRYESMIVALFGTVGGVGLGVFLGWALVQAANHAQGIATFTTPVGQLIVVLLVGAVAGVLAGIRPARRAARLNVLAAIAAE